MVNKKSGKTKNSKKPKSRSSVISKNEGALIRKINLAWKNFLTFLILFILSFVLYSFSTTELFLNFFGILSVIVGVMSLTFLIVFFILVVVRNSRNKPRLKKSKSRKKKKKRKK